MTWPKVTHWGTGLFCCLCFLCRIKDQNTTFLPLHAALYVIMTFKLVQLVHKALTNTKERRNFWQLSWRRKKRSEMEKKLTLFSFLQRKDKGKPLSAAEVAWDTEIQNTESSSCVVVHPVSMRPISALKYTDRNWGDELVDGKRAGGQDDNKKDNTRVNEGGKMSLRQKGCQDGWHVLDQLCSVIGKIPCNVPEAKSSD